jgi:hypothetical protein
METIHAPAPEIATSAPTARIMEGCAPESVGQKLPPEPVPGEPTPRVFPATPETVPRPRMATADGSGFPA